MCAGSLTAGTSSNSQSSPDHEFETDNALYTCSMARSAFYKLGRIAGVQVRKAKWMWESVAGNEADGIQAEHAVILISRSDIRHNTSKLARVSGEAAASEPSAPTPRHS